MNEQKHTPGHWYATAGYIAAKTEAGHRVICSMSRADSCMNYAAGVGSTEDASNARLIAAAPDMLAALRALYEHCAMIHKSWGDGDNSKQANAAKKAGLAAIAQAEGK
jgi:hypothetical protein